MLKLVENSPQDIERRAFTAMESLLARIPTIEIRHVETHPHQHSIDFAVDIRSSEGGTEYAIGCEVKSNGQPRYAETALLKLAAWQARMPSLTALVFIAPYISPTVRRMCVDRNVGYLDFAGNCLIRVGPVYIERIAAEAPPAAQRELKSIYKPKSARVLRVLLNSIGQGWKVKDLAAASGVSLGHVSNVRSALRDRNWITEDSHGMVLSKPGELLDEWRDVYEGAVGETFNFYTTLHGSMLQRAARQVMNAQKEIGHVAVMSSFSAADWIAPYGRTGKTYFYADQFGLERLVSSLSLQPAKSGANVQITVAKDDGLFLSTLEPSPGVVCTSPVQTYLDLYVAGERGQESAEHLREEKFEW